MLNFGDALRSIMERKRVTGQQLARLIGISATSVSKILHGHSKPRQATLSRIMKALCDNPEEETEIRNSYYGIDHDLPEEQVEESQANYNAERDRVARYMEIRTQAMAFKNALERFLSEGEFSYTKDYCEGNFSIDFLVEIGDTQIALESKFNTSRDLEKSIGLAQLFHSNTRCEQTYLVVPYIDHISEAAVKAHTSTIEIIPLQEVISKLESYREAKVHS